MRGSRRRPAAEQLLDIALRRGRRRQAHQQRQGKSDPVHRQLPWGIHTVDNLPTATNAAAAGWFPGAVAPGVASARAGTAQPWAGLMVNGANGE